MKIKFVKNLNKNSNEFLPLNKSYELDLIEKLSDSDNYFYYELVNFLNTNIGFDFLQFSEKSELIYFNVSEFPNDESIDQEGVDLLQQDLMSNINSSLEEVGLKFEWDDDYYVSPRVYFTDFYNFLSKSINIIGIKSSFKKELLKQDLIDKYGDLEKIYIEEVEDPKFTDFSFKIKKEFLNSMNEIIDFINKFENA